MSDDEPPMSRADLLALERTRLALERTMMGWMRTAVAMIGFGFTIFKFVEYLRQSGLAPPRSPFLTARGLALMLIVSSTVLLVLATIQYRRSLRWLWQRGARRTHDTALIGAILVALIGLATLTTVILTPPS